MEPPDPRVYLAAERTFLAWIRTGLALMGFGFIAARFSLFLRYMGAHDPSMPHTGGMSLPGGVTLIVVGVVVIVCAAMRHHRQVRALDRGEFRGAFGSKFAFFIAGFLAVMGTLLAVYVSGM